MREEEDDDDDIIVGEEINFLTKAKQSSWWAVLCVDDFDHVHVERRRRGEARKSAKFLSATSSLT